MLTHNNTLLENGKVEVDVKYIFLKDAFFHCM